MQVTIDHKILGTAIKDLTTLVNNVSGAKTVAESGTPVSLPSLKPLTRKTQWMNDQHPMLQGLHDIAVLMADKGSTVSSFEVGNTTRDIEKLLGEKLAEKGREIHAPADDEESKAYIAMLQSWSHDPATMAAFQLELGPEGSLRLMSQWARNYDDPWDHNYSEQQSQLMALMQQSLETATLPGGFSTQEERDFAHGLVDAATVDSEDLMGRGAYNPSGALAFLLRDGHFGDEFIETTLGDLDQYERQDNNGASGLWGNRWNEPDFSRFMPFGDANTTNNLDPLASAFSAVANNPEVALSFFADDDGDPPRAEYYIKERNWDQDNFDGISAALDAATTDPDIIGGDEATRNAAAKLASQTVNYFSERKYVDDIPEMLARQPENGAAEDLAHILSTYMNGVNSGLDNKDADIGQYNGVPAFDRESLEKFGLAAMSTDQGLAEVTNGMNQYRALHLGELADNLAEHDTDDNRSLLRTGIQEDARLQGFFLDVQGEDKIHDAAARDARTRAMISHLTDVVDLVPIPGVDQLEGVTKDAVNLTINTVKGSAYDSFADSIAHEESDTRSHYESVADEVNRREQFTMAQFLDDRGLSAHPDRMSDLARPYGSMISYEEYLELPTAQQDAVEQELFGENGVGGVYSKQDYSEAFKSEFGKYYD